MLPDVAAFEQDVRALRGTFFAADRPISIARAPGRLDVIGGIADYSGSLVMELPLAVATLAAVQLDPDPVIHIRSQGAGDGGSDVEVAIPLEMLMRGNEPLSYADAHEGLGRDEAQAWAAYVVGCWLVLMREEQVTISQGARVLLRSEVPPGKGVSSSAALEVATMRALCDALGVSLPGRELAIHCQTVENLIVGAPCGVMDQVTSACGSADQLLVLRCQPCDLLGNVALPSDMAVWGIDSGVRHAVSGSDYSSVRVGAFMGYRIIADAVGLPVTISNGRVQIADTHWRGYLANITPSEFEQRFRAILPETIDGATFLERYGGTTDSVTRVDPARTYAVLNPTAHPIYEHFRVRAFRALLNSSDPDRGPLLGELMYQAHASYSACNLGSEGTDQLVQLVRAAGVSSGLYGAKITGGGSGGTVAVLGLRSAADAVAEIAARYGEMTGHNPVIFSGSSPGALDHEVLRIG